MAAECFPFIHAYRQGEAIEKHDHMVSILLLMVRGGYRETDDLRKSRDIGPGHLLYLPKGCEHSHTCFAEGTMMVGVGMTNTYGFDEPARLDQYASLSSALSLLKCCLMNDASAALDVEAWLAETMAQVTNCRVPEETAKPAWIELASDILHERHRDSLCLAEISDEVGVNRSHLARSFRRFTGHSLGSYLRQVRLRSAAMQLLSDKVTVAEAAASSGFFDQAHFVREFKKVFGTAPSHFVRSSRRLG